jgi:hypothetical protein
LTRALDLPPGERAAWLRGLDGVEPPVLQALQRLFDADASTQDPGLALGELALQALSQRQAGQHIGPYRLECLLGEGGMAQVWRAQGLQGLNRSVALKLPRPGAGLAERFARERDLLAQPGAPAHRAPVRRRGGTASSPGWRWSACKGRRWTAGRRGSRWSSACASTCRCSTRWLMRTSAWWCIATSSRPICWSRPKGHLRLLDFGIAGLLGEPGGERLAFSADSAAPEQLEGAAPSTAMDVHALGVLLYELLAGRRPYRLARAPRAELAARAARLALAADWSGRGAGRHRRTRHGGGPGAALRQCGGAARRTAALAAPRTRRGPCCRPVPGEPTAGAAGCTGIEARCWRLGPCCWRWWGGLLLALWQAQQGAGPGAQGRGGAALFGRSVSGPPRPSSAATPNPA